MVTQANTATLVGRRLAISRSSLYYQKRREASRADRTYENQSCGMPGKNPRTDIACAWWLRRKENLPVNRKRVLRVMRERGLLAASQSSACTTK